MASLKERIEQGLAKVRGGFGQKLAGLFTGGRRIGEDFYEELEETLIAADVGVQLATDSVEYLRKKARETRASETGQLKDLLRQHFLETLERPIVAPSASQGGAASGEPLALAAAPPTVYLIVGVNGTGKTTTIAKLAARIKVHRQSVLLAAGDTFRAAAAEQLGIWADRVGVPMIRHQEGADPAAVAFDAISAAKARKTDIVIVDTAGRLHTKVNLMEELKKVHRVVAREVPGAPQEVLLVVDATTGQNAVQQAKLFKEAVGVTGVVLTKMDGTAKGGVAIAVAGEVGLPVKYVGLGESVEDLVPFDAKAFVQALVP